MESIKVKIRFIEEALGTQSANPDLHREFIASKSPNAETIEDEVAAIGVDAAVEKSMTIFPKVADGTPFIYDYQIRGFFKEACGALKKVPGTKSSKIKAHKKQVDNLIFVEPRQILIDLKGGMMDVCQRPLRASTPQGERISLASSESIPEGSEIEFTVKCFIDEDTELVKEWLDYGVFKGISQWRNSGKGRFTYEIID
ncbi:MAG: hypothetical protein ACI4RG_05910 [Huintestinicola sp.]